MDSATNSHASKAKRAAAQLEFHEGDLSSDILEVAGPTYAFRSNGNNTLVRNTIKFSGYPAGDANFYSIGYGAIIVYKPGKELCDSVLKDVRRHADFVRWF